MSDRRDLVRALTARGVSDWVVIQRDQELAVVDEAAPRLRRVERRTRWQLVVHADTADGRGTAHLAIDAAFDDADEVVTQALALAHAAVGAAWVSTPPAAPARVRIHDPNLLDRNLLDAAGAVLRGVARPGGAIVVASLGIVREAVAVAARQGFHAEWQATLLRADALVGVGDRSLEVSREVRQLLDLDLDAAIAGAAADLQLLGAARPPIAGPCAVVLGPEALLHGGLGVWAAFASQADSVVERQGLTRYREHAPIAPGAEQAPEPLTVISDGALELGTRSAPIGSDGDAVRRFPLVEHGIAAGLGLTPREAAFRHREPNGGVRNLVVELGGWSGALPSGIRTVEIRRLRELAIDPYTGEANLEIALGIDRATGTPFAGGTIRLDLVDALARARRSATRIRRGAYEGPNAVLIERAELIA